MATIKIRGRLEPIIVDDAIAKKVKARKFGDGVAQAQPNELVDLGEWSGEYGRIVEIEFQRKENDEARRAEAQRKLEEEKRKEEEWLKKPAEEKAKSETMFETAYAMRMFGKFRCELPPDVSKRAYEVRLQWFKDHPADWSVPSSAYPEDLLPPKGKSGRAILADKMRVKPEDPLAF